MSVARLNACQLALAAAIGALAVIVGSQSIDREDERREVERSAALLANVVTHRINGAVIAVTRAIEVTVAQGGISAGPDGQALVERWARARPVYGAVFVVSAAGRIAASSSPKLLGQDVSYEPWFAAARNGTTIADATGSRALSSTQATEGIVASPIRDAAGRTQGVVVLTLGERWFAEATQEAKRSVGMSEQPSSVTILSAGGAVLYRSGSGLVETAGAAEMSARGTGPEAATDWTTIARLPQGTGGGVPAVPWELLQAGLLASLAMGLMGWWLGRMGDRRLAEVADEAGPRSDETGARNGVGQLVDRIAALREREAQATRMGRDSRMALTRSRDRLHAFEGLSGWTYWSIDLEQGHTTWSHRVPGSQSASERTMTLESVASYVLPEDRELLRMTLQAASEDDGIHDIELRLSGGGRDGRRLLVRLERAVEGRGLHLHALTRETAKDASGQSRSAAQADSAAAERRHTSSLLRSVVDGVVIDLNDVLTLAISNLDALRDRGADRLISDRMMRALWRGAGLTNRMVAYVRQQIPSLQASVVADVVNGLRPFLVASLPATMTFDVRLDDDLASVRCSDRQLELVLMNLALHAQAEAPHGTSIRLEGRNFDTRVRLSVCATGPTLRTAPGEGEEKGLAAVRMLVTQMAGELIEREEDGRRVYELLLAADEVNAPRPELHADEASSARILLVAGDALMRATLSEALRDMGHLVTEVRSGADAVGRLGQASFDVLVTEQNLPVMTGLQLAATARRLLPGLKIVIISAKGQLPRSAEAFLCLDKPFGRAELAHVLSLPAPAPTKAQAA